LPLAALTLVSAAILAHEVLLTRLLAIVHWHHFVGIVVGTALLGYGIAGSGTALLLDRLRPHASVAFAAAAALLGPAALASVVLAQRLPFNALELLWDPAQLGWLLALDLALLVPFALGAVCPALWLACLDRPVGRIYRADLVGAGAGAVLVVLLLTLAPLPVALRAVAAIGPLAGALALIRVRRSAALALLAVAALLLGLPPSWPPLRLSEFKGLSQALLVPETRVVHERSGPLALLSVVESGRIPFRLVTGLSLTETRPPAPQLGLFVDGEGPAAITAFNGEAAPLAYLGRTLEALPYRLLEAPDVLLLGLGGGDGLLLALTQGGRSVEVVEPDRQLARLLRDDLADLTSAARDPMVRLRVDDPRRLLADPRGSFDLVALPPLGADAGAASLRPSPLHTVEALADGLARLRPGGLLAVPHALRLPPRDSLKLMLTALEALEARGAAEAARHLLLVRSWDAVLLLVGEHPLDPGLLAAAADFARAQGFDVEWLGGPPPHVPPFNRLPRPYFAEALEGLAGPGRAELVRAYAFDIRPATDDRPYFHDFFRWSALGELWALRRQGAAGLLDWGYPMQLAALVLAIGLSLLLMLLPLRLGLRGRAPPALRRRTLAYFALIGVAFMLVEIGAIHQLTLVLGHPVHALAVALAGFLVLAGLGAGTAGRVAERLGARALPATIAAVGIVATALIAAAPRLVAWLVPLPDGVREAAALAGLAPLALVMGLPFPLALARLREAAPGLVPWAFGVNGCASVAGALLASLLAVAIGVRATMAAALVLYVAAALVAGAPLRRSSGRSG
jgi:hypothetical protein